MLNGKKEKDYKLKENVVSLGSILIAIIAIISNVVISINNNKTQFETKKFEITYEERKTIYIDLLRNAISINHTVNSLKRLRQDWFDTSFLKEKQDFLDTSTFYSQLISTKKLVDQLNAFADTIDYKLIEIHPVINIAMRNVLMEYFKRLESQLQSFLLFCYEQVSKEDLILKIACSLHQGLMNKYKYINDNDKFLIFGNYYGILSNNDNFIHYLSDSLYVKLFPD